MDELRACGVLRYRLRPVTLATSGVAGVAEHRAPAVCIRVNIWTCIAETGRRRGAAGGGNTYAPKLTVCTTAAARALLRHIRIMP